MGDRSLRFLLLGEDRSASSTMDKVGKKAGGLGGKLGGVAKGVGAAFGGVAVGGILGLGAALVQGGRDAASYQEITAKTAAVVKSTGGAANVSVAGVKSLAGELESLSGIDEEAIINGENMLLTFTNVKNGVGKGNDVFDQATKTVVDMSAALGQDTKASAIQLGKALNDPIKGVSALSKVGVSFTEQQKEQIKTLVGSGKTMEAQKVILGELNKEFGGAAKAAGSGLNGSIARVKDSFSDLFRNIATPLLPAFASGMEKVSAGITKAGPAIGAFVTKAGGAFRNVFGFVQRVVIPIAGKYLGNILAGLRSGFQSVAAAVQKNRPELEQLGRGLIAVGKVVYAVLGPTLKVAFIVLGKTIGIAIGAIGGFVRAFNAIRGPVTTVLSVISTAFLGVVGAIVGGAAKAFGWVPGLGPKLNAAAKKFGEFKDSVNSELSKLKDQEIKVKVVKGTATGGASSGSGVVGHAMDIGGRQFRRASGGPVSVGGSVWAGERGAEIIEFPRGGSVRSTSASRRMASASSTPLQVHFSGPVYGADVDVLARKLTPALIRAMREHEAGGGRGVIYG